MEHYFAKFAVFITFLASVEGTVFANHDTVFINAESSPTSSFRHRDVQVDNNDTVIVSSRCTTTRGKQGSCQEISECYPFLFPLNYTNSQHLPRPQNNMNLELINILIEIAGICDLPQGTSQDIKQVLDAQFLICCPDPVTFDSLPVTDNASNNDTVPQKRKTCQHFTPEDEDWGKIKKNTMNKNNSSSETDRIVGGTTVKSPLEFPYMVAILLGKRQFCGGSLIESDWVLTAAHCVHNMESDDIAKLRLIFGDLNLKKNDVPIQTRSASHVMFHKGFTMKKLQNDIALIQLSSPVIFTPSVYPICIHDGETSVEGLTGDMAGWGQTCDGCESSKKLKKAQLKILPHEECVEDYDGLIQVTDKMLCADGQGMASCVGDSGGGLAIHRQTNAELVGLVSFGVDCGRKPSCFTKVSAYQNWIDGNMQRFRNDD